MTKIGQGVGSQDRVSEVRTGCPKLGQGVRSQDRVSEVRTGCPKLGHTTKTLLYLPRIFPENEDTCDGDNDEPHQAASNPCGDTD